MDLEKFSNPVYILPDQTKVPNIMRMIQENDLLFKAWLVQSIDGGIAVAVVREYEEKVRRLLEELDWKIPEDPPGFLRGKIDGRI